MKGPSEANAYRNMARAMLNQMQEYHDTLIKSRIPASDMTIGMALVAAMLAIEARLGELVNKLEDKL